MAVRLSIPRKMVCGGMPKNPAMRLGIVHDLTMFEASFETTRMILFPSGI